MSYLNTLTKDGDAYLITSANELVGLSKYAINGVNKCEGLTFKLTSDIDLSKIKNWTPIHTFYGIFDGENYKIVNLTIEGYENNAGLFGYVGRSGTIKNVNLLSANIKAHEDVGGIAGRNDGTISNCNFVGKLSGQKNIGGIAGHNRKIIQGCKSDCTIEVGGKNGGGILGYGYGGDFNNGYGAVIGCYSAVKIIDKTYSSCSNLGGITGWNPAGNFTMPGKSISDGWYYSEDPNLNGVGGGKGSDRTYKLYKISFGGEVTVNSSFNGVDNASVDINGKTYYKNGSTITVKGALDEIEVSGFNVTLKYNGNIIEVDKITIRIL